MNSFGYSDLLTRFNKIDLKELKFITDTIKFDELFSDESQEPENMKENIYESNDIYIEPKETKKKTTKQEGVVLIGKAEEKK